MTPKSLANILKNNDILLAFGLVLVVVMMVIPLPAPILDILLVINISLAIIIMLVCLFTTEPLGFSSFPVILLISTIFRLSLNISSTRLILLYGQAGEVIKSFGDFVIRGNYVVGFVIFIILVIVNFMVITGGAGRVAEVSARFTLDSMPGKQLSIDADLNSGIINEEQAKARRRKLEREADFYGTMDGASKFVKGDATAGIIITVINILGGLIIGVWQLKMDFMTALNTFTILTVGDGLVSQIPALLISFATGLIVSRASGQETGLSEDIKKEMFSNPKVLIVVSTFLFMLGIVPGMPTIPFFLISIAIGFLAYFLIKEQEKEAAQAIEIKKEEENKEYDEQLYKKKKKATRETVMELLKIEDIEIEIGYRLVPLLNLEKGGDLLERISQIRRQTALDMGIVLPSIRVRDNMQLGPNHYEIKLKGSTIEGGDVYPDKTLAMNAGGVEEIDLQGEKTIEPVFKLPAIWINESDKDMAEAAGYTTVSAAAVISTHLTEIIKNNAVEILTRNDVQQLIDNLKKEITEEAVSELMKDINVALVQQVMQNLLKEHVSVRDLRTILEVCSANAMISKNPDFLTENVRQALARNICKQNLSDSGDLLVITLSPDAENVIAKSVSPDSNSLVLEPGFVRKIAASMQEELEKALTTYGSQPVILTSAPIRLPFKRMIERQFPQITVMSLNEITSSTRVRSVGVIKADTQQLL